MMRLSIIISLLQFYLSFKINFLSIEKHSSITSAQFLKSIKKTSLNSLGSDVLERPDDEDSPEFKEYLRQLMIMQANRAKLGFASKCFKYFY